MASGPCQRRQSEEKDPLTRGQPVLSVFKSLVRQLGYSRLEKGLPQRQKQPRHQGAGGVGEPPEHGTRERAGAVVQAPPRRQAQGYAEAASRGRPDLQVLQP